MMKISKRQIKTEKARITNKVKNNRGITLIALLVTIVVLIILATISIYAVLGENGLIAKAQQAKDVHEQGKQEEQNNLDNYAEYVENYLNGSGGGSSSNNPPAGTEVKKPEKWTSTEVTPIADGNGGTIPLPDDLYYIGGDINTGIVISDKQGDTMDASGITSGNQFVWIAVASEADLTRIKFDTTTGKPIAGLDTTRYTEPFASGYPTEASEYTTMHDQVLKYGGFYIGRYEAGVNSTTLRTTVTEAQTVVSKKGVAPYNYVPWGKSMNDVGEIGGKSGAVYLATNFASQEGYTSVESTLIYGSQWDAMCRYIGDSQRTTPTKSAPELTGSVTTDVSKNIYDLAGNCWEWTMEANTTGSRVQRGSFCSYADPVSIRGSIFPDSSSANGSFRCGLYVK